MDVATNSLPVIVPVERKIFAPPPVTTTLERKPPEGSVFIKKDYLPSPAKIIKLEKTRDEVTRILNFSQIEEASKLEIKTETETISSRSMVVKDVDEIIVKTEQTTALKTLKTEPLDCTKHLKEESIIKPHVFAVLEKKIAEVAATIKKDAIPRIGSGEKKVDKHRDTNSKSSSSSSSRRSSSSSNRECSRCYKRSKIRKTNAAVQCNVPSVSHVSMLDTMDGHPNAAILNRDLNCINTGLPDLKYERFFRIEVHSNGGASVVHMYQDEINELSKEEMDELVDEFFKVAFSEDEDGNAHYVMGIVHDAAGYLPDLLEHMAENYSTLTVKAGVMGRNSDIETSTMSQYNEQVCFLETCRR